MNEAIRILLIKYITGNADETERSQIQEWIAESQDNWDDYISLKETWQDVLHHPGHQAVNTAAALQRLRDKLQLGQPASTKEPAPASPSASAPDRSTELAPTRRLWLTRGRAAVIGGLVLAAGTTLALLYNHNPRTPAPITAFELFVPDGKMKTLLLPDSTLVWLNAGTHFSYTADYGRTNREVRLEGEGYFVVHHNEKIPFQVRTSGYTIRDVGTTFTIRSYPDNRNFETAVLEGKVEVKGHFTKDEEEKILLGKNQVLKVPQHPAIDPQKNIPPASGTTATATPAPKPAIQVIETSKLDSYAGWKDRLLVFDEETFDEVAKRLGRTFAVKIRITSEQLAAFRYTGRFNKVPNIAAALEIIKETTPIRYRMENDSIIISPNKQR